TLADVTSYVTVPWRSPKPASHLSSRSGATDTTRVNAASHVEAERPQLVAAVVGDLLRAPRRHPDPVDPEVVDQAVQRHPGLVLDHVGQRAGRRRQRHVDGRRTGVVDGDAVDQAEVDDVDPELGVYDVLQ